MIVALLNKKGDIYKSTLATRTTSELTMSGQQVVLLDANPHGSVLDCTQRRS